MRLNEGKRQDGFDVLNEIILSCIKHAYKYHSRGLSHLAYLTRRIFSNPSVVIQSY